ncbi:hypothetical protein LguiB_026344 [Lonicera macranthoides]
MSVHQWSLSFGPFWVAALQTDKREEEEAPHYYSFIQRATLDARFTQLKALVTPLKSQQQGQAPLGSDPAAAQIAPPIDPAPALIAPPSDPAPAQQHRGGVGPGSRSLQNLGFCKPAVFRVETKEQGPNWDSYLRSKDFELKSQLSLLETCGAEQTGFDKTQEQARLGSNPAAPQSAPHDLSQQLHGGTINLCTFFYKLAQAPLCSDPAALRSAPPHDLSLVRDGGVEPGSISPELWRSYASIGSSLRGAAFKIVSLKDEEDEEEHQEQEAPTGPDLSRQQPVEVPTDQRTTRESRNTNSDAPGAPGSSTRGSTPNAPRTDGTNENNPQNPQPREQNPVSLSFSGAEEIDDLAYMDEWESV